MQSLTEKHRPRTLAAVFGQGAIVNQLHDFLDAPHSTAFFFEGPTGVGKTSVAHALAYDLGVEVEYGPYGGWYTVPSGEQKADTVRESLRQIRFTPMMGSGWRVVLIDEADKMSDAVKHLWLSALEDLPPRTLVIFTTNEPGKFEPRFLDRTERFKFASNGRMLLQDAQALAAHIWRAETGRDPSECPAIDPACVKGLIDLEGRISFRRVVRFMEGQLRNVARLPEPAKPKPVRRDLNGKVMPPVGSYPGSVEGGIMGPNKAPTRTPPVQAEPVPEIRYLDETPTEILYESDPAFALKPPPEKPKTLFQAAFEAKHNRPPVTVLHDPRSGTMRIIKRA